MQSDTRRFKVGDLVFKEKGYRFPGEVVAAFATRAGKMRYVVECTLEGCEGMLHVYNGGQLLRDAVAEDARQVATDRANTLRRECAP